MNTFTKVDVVCRTCMCEPSEKIQFLHFDTIESTFTQTTIRQKLEAFAPELDLTITFSPYICINCVGAIEFIHKFKKKCLETEERIQNYLRQSLVTEEHDHVGTFLKITDVQSLSPHETSLQPVTNGIVPKIEPRDIKQEAIELCAPIDQTPVENGNPHLEIVDFGSVLFNTDDNVQTTNENVQTTNENVQITNDNVQRSNENVQIMNDNNVETINNDDVEISNDISDMEFLYADDNVEISNDISDMVFLNTNDNVEIMQDVNVAILQDVNVEIINDISDAVVLNADEIMKDDNAEINNHICEDSINDTGSFSSHTSKANSECSDYNNKKINNLRYDYTVFETFNMKRKKQTILYKCHNCPYSVTYRSLINAHLKTHRKENSYQCEQCGFNSSLKTVLISHAKKHGKSNSCDYYDDNVATAFVSRLNVYKTGHKCDKLFLCINCDFVAHNPNDFKTHLKTHETNT